MDRLTFSVTPALDGRSVGQLLRAVFAMTDGQISSAKFREDGILLNGRRARVTETARAGDILSVPIADRGVNEALPCDADVRILWEDASFAVLDKPGGISVHGAKGPTVAGFLSKKWGRNIQFHPVNRLDVGTSGLMIVAKDGYAHDRLRRILHTEAFIREYLAVAEGVFPSDSGTITLPVSRAAGPDRRRAVDPDGLPSRTDYTLIAANAEHSLLRLRLFTGRTHQIRLHLSAIGHPLVGDALYGSASPLIGRPALHSHSIRLTHPLTGERLCFTSPLPSDIRQLLPDDNKFL